MKWFKHLTTSMDDLFVKDLERKFGDAGYAFWFKTLELIGNHGEEGKLKISWTNYTEKLHKRRTQVEQLLNFCSTSGKLLVIIEKEFVNLECKKFAEYSDNYTKYGKSLQSDLKENTKQEVEVDKKKKEKKKEQEHTEDFTHPIFDNVTFANAWINFKQMRSEIKRPLKATAEKTQIEKLSKLPIDTAIKMVEQSTANQWQGIFELKGNINAITSNGVRKSDQTARATYTKTPEQVREDVRNTAESIRLLRNQRD